jgi:hypothetical protein
MLRQRALQIVLVLVGLLFSAAILPVVGGLRDPSHSDTGDTMMMGRCSKSIGAPKPDRIRSLASQRSGFLSGSAVLVVIGITLIVLTPRRQPEQRAVAA